MLAASGTPTATIVWWTAARACWALVVSTAGALVRPRGPQQATLAAAAVAVEDYPGGPPQSRSPNHATRALHDAWDCCHAAGVTTGVAPTVIELRALQRRFVHAAAVARARPSTADDVRAVDPLPAPSVRHRLQRAGRAATPPHSGSVRRVWGLGAMCVAAGLPRADWAVFSAAMILHVGPDRVLGSLRGVHRFAGTALGLAVLFLLTVVDPSTLLLVVCVAVLVGATEALLVRNDGLAMVAVVPMVILIGEMGVPGDIAAVITDRLIETCLGVVVALGVLWGVRPRAHRRELLAADRAVQQSVQELAAAIDDGDRRRVGSGRRALEFDLRYATTAPSLPHIAIRGGPTSSGRDTTTSTRSVTRRCGRRRYSRHLSTTAPQIVEADRRPAETCTGPAI